jgi:hypothetical protein
MFAPRLHGRIYVVSLKVKPAGKDRSHPPDY